MTKFEMHWQAPEFEYRGRDVSWYWITIIIAAAMVAFAVWQKDFLFGFFIIVAEILAIVWASREPLMIPFSLTDHALSITERKHYTMSEFEAFSADNATPLAGDGALPGEPHAPTGQFAEIMFHFKGKLKTPLFVRIPPPQLEEARKNLRLILREIEHDPSLIDSLEKLIGF